MKAHLLEHLQQSDSVRWGILFITKKALIKYSHSIHWRVRRAKKIFTVVNLQKAKSSREVKAANTNLIFFPFLLFSPFFCRTFFIYSFAPIFSLTTLISSVLGNFTRKYFFSSIGWFSPFTKRGYTKTFDYGLWHAIVDWFWNKRETLKLNATANIQLHWNVKDPLMVFRFCFQIAKTLCKWLQPSLGWCILRNMNVRY